MTTVIKKPSAIVWFALLLITGAVSGILLPANPDTLRALHISSTVYHASVLTLILPYAVIWFSAFYAYEKLRQYATKIKKSREGEAFKKIADGVGVLAWGLALPTILSIVMGAIVARHPGFAFIRTLINSYLAMIVSVVSFTLVSRGTRQFNEIAHIRPSLPGAQLVMLAFTIIGAFFVTLVVHAQDTGHNPYHLPLTVLILTLIIPHMYAWFIGLLSAYEVLLYSHKATGVLYKRALSYFTGGFAIVVCAAIAVQFLTGAYINRTSISLGAVMIETYTLLVIEAAGYALIALAAKRLKRLEEV
jgi:hypothetical protein